MNTALSSGKTFMSKYDLLTNHVKMFLRLQKHVRGSNRLPRRF